MATDGWKSPVRVRYTRTCSPPSASIPSAIRASPSAWALTGWRCCAPASTTCDCSSRTICAFCGNSRDPFAGMKFSEHWLRTLVDPPLDSAALAHALTMAGFEVEERTPAAPPFRGVVVSRVLDVERHPNADRLTVCRVDAG